MTDQTTTPTVSEAQKLANEIDGQQIDLWHFASGPGAVERKQLSKAKVGLIVSALRAMQTSAAAHTRSNAADMEG